MPRHSCVQGGTFGRATMASQGFGRDVRVRDGTHDVCAGFGWSRDMLICFPSGKARVGLALVKREQSRCHGRPPRVRSWPWLGRGVPSTCVYMVVSIVRSWALHRREGVTLVPYGCAMRATPGCSIVRRQQAHASVVRCVSATEGHGECVCTCDMSTRTIGMRSMRSL